MSDKQTGKEDVQVIQAWNPPVDWVRQQIEKAGTTIGSVHFKKRENGELRKMCYRLHVTKPSVAKAPKGISTDTVTSTVTTTTKEVCSCGKDRGNGAGQCSNGPFTTVSVVTPVKAAKVTKQVDKKVIDKANNQMTVLDCNKTVKDTSGKVIGRGQWRTIPLENVTRIKNSGAEVIVNRY